MTKSLALTLVAVLSCLPFFGQGDANYDCQDVATCDTTVDFSFTLDANEFDAMAFPFTGGITAVGVTMDWSGDGITYPSDLSLSLCSPEGDCIAIYALGGTLPGTVVGAWPDSWNDTQDGIYSACFSLGENATIGSGEWILTGLNSFGSSTDNLAFQGSITLFYECSNFPVCEDVTACNFGSPADCVFPGCGKGNACNYDPDAACYDESTCTYDYCSTCPNAPCDSLIDFSFVLGPEETASMDIPFNGSVLGYEVQVNWQQSGGSYPSDLSLSLCSPFGDCIAIAGFSGVLPGVQIGGWPQFWNSTTSSLYEACFTFSDLFLEGNGVWTLNVQNTFPNSNDDILFEGTLVLLYDCDPESPCEDSSACNFGQPGPCTYPGCTDEGACNYDPDAACAGDLCTYDCIGCMDEAACNYDASATLPGECDYACYGCIEAYACNYDPLATLADECDYSCYGCTDTNACNFDSEATVDEGTCEYCSCGITPMVTATGGVDQDGVNTANATLLATDGGIAQCRLRDTTVILFGVEDGPFIEIDGTADHVLALSIDSLLYAYGRNDYGQAAVPPNLPKPIAFSAGQTHSVAVDESGQAHGWGDGSSGQLNFGATSGLVGIEAGVYHTLGWNAEGEIILAVGSNDFGQLDVPDGLVVQKVSSSLHNMALTPDGQVVCWGYNEYGQCNVPSFDQPVVDIAASKRASLALLEDGSLVIWGRLKHIEPIEGAVAISGNISMDYFSILTQNGRIHHLSVSWFLTFQGPSATALVEARPNCTDWCTDRDLDGVCDSRDDCIGTLGECGCECLNDENENGICDELEVRGCKNENALNFNRFATLTGSCRFGLHDDLPLDDGMEEACNFDPDSLSAGLSAEDGPDPYDSFEVSQYLMGVLEYSSCGGCMDPYGCNFNQEATWEDGTCEYSSCTGCLDPLACNFNPMVQATDSCDYCSCHWTDPMVDDNALSTLTINSRGVAELRSNSTISLPELRYGDPIEGVMRRSGVRTGSCGFNAAALIMQDSSLEEMSNMDAEHLLRLQYKEEFEREDLLGVDLHVRAIEEETTKPAGNDFIQVATEGTATAALRADGSVEIWGSDVLYFGDWAESAQGSNGLNILEWARSLENIVHVEFSDVLRGVLALDGNGQLHAYSPRFSYEGIPEGFEYGTAFMECGYFGRCVLVHEDGSHAYMFAEGDYISAISEPLEVPNWAAGTVEVLFEIGTPVNLSLSFIGMRNAALYDNGNMAIVRGGEGEPDETYPITILTAEEVPGLVDAVHGIVHSAVLDEGGELIRYDLDTLTGLMVSSYPVDALNEFPDLDFFVDQFPRRMLLGPPMDCQGCPDSDGDGICDVVDDCEGEEDALGVCGGDCLGDFDHDGECDLLDRPGCTYVEACTYLEEATWDDGSCVFSMIPTDADFSGLGGGCPSDLDGNGTVATSDLLVLLTAFGEECAPEEVDFFDPCFDEVPFDCGSPYSFHGVEYPTVEIGALCWFQTNLGSPYFANGQPVDMAANIDAWDAADGSLAAPPGWDVELVETYGLLYNAAAISDPRGLCPWGWHVSTDAEWMDAEISAGMDLEDAVSLGNRGASENIASRFKDNSPLWGFAGGGNNITGFTALPAGRIDHLGNNNSQGASAWFWAAPPNPDDSRALRSMSSGNGGIFRDTDNSTQGFSVRCVKE